MADAKVTKSAETGKFVSKEEAEQNPDTTFSQTIERSTATHKTDSDSKVFTVDLYQSHWRRTRTETMSITAKDQKDAEKQAQAWVKDKGLKKDFDLVVSEVAQPDESDQDAPTEE